MLTFGRFAGFLHRRACSAVLLQLQLQRNRGRSNLLSLRQNRHPLHNIAEFPRIAWPRIAFEQRPNFGVKPTLAKTVARAEFVEKILSHGSNVLGSLTQGRNPKRYYAHAVIKVFAKLSLRHHGLQIAVGG